MPDEMHKKRKALSLYMLKYPISTTEKEWVTRAGLLAQVVINHHGGFRCGYVQIPPHHVFYNNDVPTDEGYITYIIDNLDVHGGVTFSGNRTGEDGYFIGFDCGHVGDAIDFELIIDPLVQANRRQMKEQHPDPDDYEIRSLEYCIEQCESLASQIVHWGARILIEPDANSDNT